MFDFLFNPHVDVLDLSQDYLPFTERNVERNFRIGRLASVRCSVINSSLL